MAFRKYCLAIEVAKKDRAMLLDTLVHVLDFVNNVIDANDNLDSSFDQSSLQRATEDVERVAADVNCGKDATAESKSLDKSIYSSVELETFCFLGRLAMIMKSRGVRLRTAFFKTVPLDLFGDKRLNRELLVFKVDGSHNALPTLDGFNSASISTLSVFSLGSIATPTVKS